MKTAISHIGKKISKIELNPHTEDTGTQSLLQITQAINNNLSAEGLLKMYQAILVRHVGVERFAVFMEEEKWNCTNHHGLDPKELEEVTGKFQPEFKQVVHLRNDPALSKYFEFVIPVYHKEKPLMFALLGEMKTRDENDLNEKLNYVQILSSIISMAIENKRLYRAQKNQQHLQSELVLAGHLQTMLIPDNLPDDERIQMSGVYSPQEEVGGDYYDYIPLNDEECIFCIGDISGKGVPAALLMANFQARLRSYADQYTSLESLIENLNNHVNNITKGEKYVTFFLAKFNFITRELQYVNAGHNAAILCYEGKTKLLEEGCTILGMFEKLPYVNVQSLHLPSAFLIFCYTDGLSDIENQKGEPLEVHSLAEFIKNHQYLRVQTMNKKVIEYLEKFKGSGLSNDDLSILTCRIF